MAQEPDSTPDTAVRNRLRRSIRLLWIGIMVMVIATMPAAAFVDELGNTIGSSGGEQLADLGWWILFLAVVYVGTGRLVKALKDCGSVHENTRAQGHEEIVPAALTLFGGIVLVLAFATFFARIFPESWSWLGADLTEHVNLPFGGGGGGDAGSAADPGMIYTPEMSDVLIDVSLHATDVVLVLF